MVYTQKVLAYDWQSFIEISACFLVKYLFRRSSIKYFYYYLYYYLHNDNGLNSDKSSCYFSSYNSRVYHLYAPDISNHRQKH